MKAINGFIIENGVLIRYCGKEECTGISRIIFPEGIKLIKDNVFQNCPDLTELIVPDSID